MALGTFGSTLSDELNRLANGGTYRDMNQMVDDALAAKQWANRENITPYSTDTVGVLNEIAGLGTNRQNWLDFNGVCNYIAGTTGLPAAAALRQIYPTTDLLTGVASYYVDADEFNTPGYVYLSGTSGNFMSVPDSSDLDIVGDIDIRARMGLTSWASGAEQRLVSKFTTGQGSYSLGLQGNGTLLLTWYSDGTTGFTATSTASVPFNAGQNGWVRVTLDVDNGASGNTVTFFTSTDGVTWTVLGTPVVQAFIAVIFAGTANIGIGASSSGAAVLATGKFYQVQILNGISGTAVLNANMTGVSQSATSFLDSTGKTVSINGARQTAQDVTNLGNAGSLLPTTVGSSLAADSNDPRFLDHTGTNYVYLPGVAGNYLSTPDAAALDITGDIDLRVQVALDNWTPSGDDTLISKFGAGGNRSYRLTVTSAGNLSLIWSSDGTTLITATSSVATGITNGTIKWVRATLDVDNGSSGNTVTFFTSDNGTSWTQLGTTVVTAGITSIFNSTWTVDIGTDGGAARPLDGKIFRAQILNGIGGTTVLDVNTSVITTGAATSFTAVTGQTVTINRSTSGRKTVAVTQPTWLFGTDDYMEVNNRYMAKPAGTGNYMYLPGITSNFASTPDAAALDITGDLDLRVNVALDDWTPSATQSLIAKSTGSSNVSYRFYVRTDGKLEFAWSPTGTGAGIAGVASTVAPTITDGTALWVRFTFDVDNGAGGRTATFFTSTNGTTWTQLGTPVTTAGTTSLFSGSAPNEIGSINTGTADFARGKFFRAQVLNGINGTVAFDANFENSITSLNQASFTESSTNAATVTINRSGSTFRSAGVIDAGYLYPGATNTFSNSTTDFLNFGATQSFTVFFAARQWATPASFGNYINKKENSTNAGSGYRLGAYSTLLQTFGQIADGTNNNPDRFAATYTAGTLLNTYGVADRTAQTFTVTQNSNSSATASLAGFGAISSYWPLRIGVAASLGTGYQDFELVAAAVFRTVLTAAQIRQVTNYFANREVYL
jgi:hypothetical protein